MSDLRSSIVRAPNPKNPFATETAAVPHLSRDAFDQFVDAHDKRLVGFILGRISGNEHDADDTAQEVRALAWADLEKSPAEGGYDPGRKVSFYSFIVARCEVPRHAVRRSKEETADRTHTDEDAILRYVVEQASDPRLEAQPGRQ